MDSQIADVFPDVFPNLLIKRKINMALIGGAGGFIGSHHGDGMLATGRINIAALCLSRTHAKTTANRYRYDVSKDHCYATAAELIKAEAEYIDAVAIAVPDPDHFEIAKAALEAGLAVVLDKPITINLDQALKLLWIVLDKQIPFMTTHTYLGYPIMIAIRQAIQNGDIGSLRAVVTEYLQGWLWFNLEDDSNSDKGGHQQAKGRTNHGISCCFADIGIHALMHALFPTGLEPTRVSATLGTFVPGRELDDHATATFTCGDQLDSPIITCVSSQVTVGRENDLRTSWTGDQGSFQFDGLQPNYAMRYTPNNDPTQMRRGGAATANVSDSINGMPAGHPEGTPEAFRNLYTQFCDTLDAWLADQNPEVVNVDYPGIRAGVIGMHAIEQVVASHEAGGDWRPMNTWSEFLAMKP